MPDDQTKNDLENLAAHGIGVVNALTSLAGKSLVGGITLASTITSDLLEKAEQNQNKNQGGKQ
jgi:hypothetical protein